VLVELSGCTGGDHTQLIPGETPTGSLRTPPRCAYQPAETSSIGVSVVAPTAVAMHIQPGDPFVDLIHCLLLPDG
jgi:hypothetical protein